MATRHKTPGFDKSLEALEELVERMERGDLSLEESLRQFERGVQLVRTCRSALDEAERKVELLTEDGDLVPFAPEPEPRDDD